MNTSFLSVTTASTLAFSYPVIQTVIRGAIVGVVILTPLTSGQRPLIQVMLESPLTSMDIGREAADWLVLDWDKLWLKEFLWRTIWCYTFSKSVSQLIVGQSVSRSVDQLTDYSRMLLSATFKIFIRGSFQTQNDDDLDVSVLKTLKPHVFWPSIAIFWWSL